VFYVKIAVVYESKTGNTQELAEEIYNYLEDEKILCNIDEDDFPQADFYFIGFGIRNQNCSLNMTEILEKIEDAGYALFITCGFSATEKYKERILRNISAWLPDDAEYVGSFLCQGKVDEDVQEQIVNKMLESEEILYEMFNNGWSHPDETDKINLCNFVDDSLESWR